MTPAASALLETLYEASRGLQQAHDLAKAMGDAVLARRCFDVGLDVLRLIGTVVKQHAEHQGSAL